MISPPAWLGDASLIFLSLLVQGIPFLLIGAIAGGVINRFVPTDILIRNWPKHPLLSSLYGASFALLLPACDCAVVPVVRRLIQKGIPPSAAMAYLLAAPSLNPICLVATYFAYRFGSPWHMLLLRAGGSLLIALLLGFVASLFSPAYFLKGEVLRTTRTEAVPLAWMRINPSLPASTRQTAVSIAGGITDFLNVTQLYVLGAICSALAQTFLPIGAQLSAHAALGIPAAMATAFLLSLCSSADAFVVNAFGALGLGGQLAFLWLGPIYNLRMLFVYRSIFRYPALLAAGLILTLLILLMAFAAQVLT